MEELGFGTGDFTIEFWLNYTGGNGYISFFDMNGAYTGHGYTGNYIYYGLSTGTKQLLIWNDGTVMVSGVPIVNDTWQHHAIVRKDGILSLYLDGVLSGTLIWAVDLGAKRPITIGANSQNPIAQFTAGQIDDFRITKGVARYSNTFTVPTKAFPDK